MQHLTSTINFITRHNARLLQFTFYKKRVLAIALMLIGAAITTPAASQDTCFSCNYDSLLLELKVEKSNKERVKLLELLVDNADYKSYLHQTILLIDQLLEANGNNLEIDAAPYRQLKKGLTDWRNRKYQLALSELKVAIELFDKQHKIIFNLLSGIRDLFNLLNLQDERKSYYQNKLSYYLVNGPYQNTASCYHVLGFYYVSKADYNLAITNYLRAASIYKKFFRKNYYNEIAVVGKLYADWGNLGKAKQYLNEALALAKPENDSAIAAYTLITLSRISIKQERLDEALNYANEALSYSANNYAPRNFDAIYSIALLQKSLVAIKRNEPDYASRYLTQAKIIANAYHPKLNNTEGDLEIDYIDYLYQQLTGNYKGAGVAIITAYNKAREEKLKPLQKKYSRELSVFYARQQKPAAALPYFEQYFKLNDQIESEQDSLKVAQFESEEREREQSERIVTLRNQNAIRDIALENRNTLIKISLIGLVVVVILSIFIYRQLLINQRTLNKLRKTQRQLIMSEKMASMGEMTSGIAHEIQNPMNFVKNFSEVSIDLIEDIKEEMAAGNTDGALHIMNDVKENLNIIGIHVNRADSIVKGMLMHTRQSTGTKEEININNLADEYLKLSYHGLKNNDRSFNTEFTKNYAADLPLVEGLPQEIGRVFINLFNNAFYSIIEKKKLAIPGYEPTIWIDTEKVGHNAVITIKDNGLGIAPKNLEKIFQPFYTTKPSGQGTGMGLSISYDIITKGHGGKMEVDTKEGEYAEFTIELPGA